MQKKKHKTSFVAALSFMQFNIENTSRRKWKTAADWKFASFHLSHCSRQAKPSLLFGCVAVVCFLREISHFSYIFLSWHSQKKRGGGRRAMRTRTAFIKDSAGDLRSFSFFVSDCASSIFNSWCTHNALNEKHKHQNKISSREIVHIATSASSRQFFICKESDGRRIFVKCLFYFCRLGIVGYRILNAVPGAWSA